MCQSGVKLFARSDLGQNSYQTRCSVSHQIEASGVEMQTKNRKVVGGMDAADQMFVEKYRVIKQ